jgi:hypothetical protein
MAMILVHELEVNDILLGQGTGRNENQGNIHFQRLLEEIVETYPKSLMILKTKLASEVLQTIRTKMGTLFGHFWPA